MHHDFYIQDLPYDLMISRMSILFGWFFHNLYIELLFIDIYTLLLISTSSRPFHTTYLPLYA